MIPGSIQLQQGGWYSTDDLDSMDRKITKPGDVQGLEVSNTGSNGLPHDPLWPTSHAARSEPLDPGAA